MKRVLALIGALLIAAPARPAAEYESWANWQRRIDDAYKGLKHRKVPGKTVGIIVPAEDRDDILTLTAAAYNVVQKNTFHTVLLFLQAPPTASLDGLAVPDAAVFDTSFGRFSVDTNLRDKLLTGTFPAHVDPTLFGLEPPREVQRQLAFLKQMLRGNATQLRVLPVYVKFSNANDQVRDYAPYVVDQIRDAGLDKDLLVITAADLTRANSDGALIKADATTLRGVRNLDIDAMIEGKEDATLPDLDALVMGLLTLRWAGADHGEILAYGDSGHLVLTKDKRIPVSYVAAGIASAPPLPADIPHAPQEKMLQIFDDSLRADILTMTRQACLSAIDPTAAKP
ncbi:MAG: AmmeMemoRadiSam system protein B, partial [Elusimicrobia bacterium]|nr:AmmeMemoRadiSam system protein B [Elusimicrobiota bacterium]